MNDAELIARFLEGDEEAFNMLIASYKEPVFSYLLAMTRNESAASDLFQEVFIKVFKNLKNYRETGKFGSWIFTAARNAAMDYHRRLCARRKFAGESGPPCEDGDTAGMDSLPSPCAGPEDALIRSEDKARLLEILDSLPAEYREVIYLREYSGLSFKEIAAASGCPIGTLLSRMSRALRIMRLKLENQNESR